MLTVKDAPRASRELTKRTSYLRKKLSEISKSEQAGTAGAAAERERLASAFIHDTQQAESLIHDTERHADAFDRASLCLRNPATPATDPLSRLACAAARLGLPAARISALAELTAHAAQRGRDAAQRAQARLDDTNDDLQATRVLGEMLDRLPSVGWDTRRVENLRKTYHRHLNAARGGKS